MGYIDENLMPGEIVLHRAKLHWIVFVWSAIFVLCAFLGLAASSGAAVAIFIVLAVLTGIPSLINYSTSEFAVTSKRVLVKVGFLRTRSLETLLAKVEGIAVEQGILGRILGYGTIEVRGTGGTKEPFHKIAEPFEFRKQVQQQVAAVQDLK